jgi:hypothetical protein
MSTWLNQTCTGQRLKLRLLYFGEERAPELVGGGKSDGRA